MCQGHIAKKAKPMLANFLLVIFFSKKYITNKDMHPKIAIGSLIDKVFKPKIAMNGIAKYESNAF